MKVGKVSRWSLGLRLTQCGAVTTNSVASTGMMIAGDDSEASVACIRDQNSSGSVCRMRRCVACLVGGYSPSSVLKYITDYGWSSTAMTGLIGVEIRRSRVGVPLVAPIIGWPRTWKFGTEYYRHRLAYGTSK